MAASNFRLELQNLINRESQENGSDTPDWILADYLVGCFEAFDNAVKAREKWYGRTAPAAPPECCPKVPPTTHLQYDPSMLERIPNDVLAAAHKVGAWFAAQGITDWELLNIRSRCPKG